MSKKFSKTIISSTMSMFLLSASISSYAAEIITSKQIGENYLLEVWDNNSANIFEIDPTGKKKSGTAVIGPINTETGYVTTFNEVEVKTAIEQFIQTQYAKDFMQANKLTEDELKNLVTGQLIQEASYSVSLPNNYPSLKSGNIENITADDVKNIASNVNEVKQVITHSTAADYRAALGNGMTSEAALLAAKDGGAMLHEFSRIGTNITNNTKAIQSNSRQLQEHNARLNDHQRQIRENHEEMKRAAAQSA
ncbi:hypothetical protein PMJ71_005100, partial [Escherichia coli]|nr:hypothetical protein [Escherichia coli]